MTLLMKSAIPNPADRKVDYGYRALVPFRQTTLRPCSQGPKESFNQARLTRVISPDYERACRVEVNVPRSPVAMRHEPDTFELEAFHRL